MEYFGIYRRIKQKLQRIPICLFPLPIVSPVTHILLSFDAFVKTDESLLTYYFPRYIVYTRVHSVHVIVL